MSKIVSSIKEAIIKSELKDGMTISFHHHLRNGDYVLNMVIDVIKELGIKNIKLNASSLFDIHSPLIDHIKENVITEIETNYMGEVIGEAISYGILDKPVTFRSHGGRPAAIESGVSPIDIAFIAAPTSDDFGNCTGKHGKSACGSLGYAFVDAINADKVIVITDNLVPYPLDDFSIPEIYIDYVVEVDEIGDAKGIVSGTTKITRDPVGLQMASLAVKAIEASGLLKDGFSFQTGAGGASLAAAQFLKDVMLEKKIKGSFCMGGVTGYMVDLLESGCFSSILDTQCFDLKAVESLRTNPSHKEVSASHYASPIAKSSIVDSLDVVILGATQIDTDFNVNVHTDSNGKIMGGSGGHSDTAAGAKMAMIIAPFSRARMSLVVDKVHTITTPGSTIDVLVTQRGIAVNPLREDLRKKFIEFGLPVVDIKELKEYSKKLNGVANSISQSDEIVANVVYRDGRIIDTIKKVIV